MIKQIPAHTNNYEKGRRGTKIDRVVMHWIVGTLESADATFQNPNRIASAHYGIGDDDVHQYVQESDTAYHAGNFAMNLRSIGIEHEGGWLVNGSRVKPSEKTHQTSAKLLKDICSRYGIPIDRTHVKLHKEVSDKVTECPGLLDVDYIIKLAKNNEEPPDMVITDQTKIPQIDNMEVQQIRSILNDRQNAINNLTSSIDTLTTQLEETKTQVKTLTKELSDAKEGLFILGEDRNRLEEKIKQLEAGVKEPVFKTSLARFLFAWAKNLG